MYRVSIDPGSSACGICVWENKTPIWCGNIYPHRDDHDNFQKIHRIMRKIEDEVWDEFPDWDEVFCELPSFFSGARGRAVAVSGDLIKLTMFVGCIYEFCRNNRVDFTPVTPMEHMGQLPQPVLIQRIRQKLPDIDKLNPKSHAWDSISIGWYGLTGKAL